MVQRSRLDLSQLPKMPWKNGGGVSTDIACEPPGAGWDDSQWRVAVAEIARDGPFSHFPRLQRCFVPLGSGISLAIAGASPRSLEAFETTSFSGDDQTLCTIAPQVLARGPVQAFNLMFRPQRWQGSVTAHAAPLRLAAATGTARIFFVARGGVRLVGDDGQPFALDAGQALVDGDGGEALAIEPYRPWSMLLLARIARRAEA